MGKTDPDGARPPPAVDGARADGHAGHHRRPQHDGVRLRRRRGPLRGDLRRRAGAGREPPRRGGRRLRHRPGPPRARPHPPLHAHDRRGRAGPRADVPAGCTPAAPFGKSLAEQGVWEERIADARIAIDQARLYTLYAAWLMDTAGQQGRPHARSPASRWPSRSWRSRSSTTPSRPSAPPASARTRRWPACTPASAACAWPTGPTRCTAASPSASSAAGHRGPRSGGPRSGS